MTHLRLTDVFAPEFWPARNEAPHQFTPRCVLQHLDIHTAPSQQSLLAQKVSFSPMTTLGCHRAGSHRLHIAHGESVVYRTDSR